MSLFDMLVDTAAVVGAVAFAGYVVGNQPQRVQRPPRIDHNVYTGMGVRPIQPYQVAQPYAGGRVKGLFIGINYFGSNCELSGCVNDVRTMLQTLHKIQFPLGETCILVDDPNLPGFGGLPTRQNIIAHMQWLVKDARPGDVLFFHYSGHGSETEAANDSDEAKDQVLCPVDYNTAGGIIDDDIFNLLCRNLPGGVRLTCLFDCCHSGSILDLPYAFVGSSNVQYGGGLQMKQIRRSNFCAGDVLMISGCADNQTSSDVQDTSTFGSGQRQAGGAATQALTHVLLSTQGLNIAQVTLEMRQVLKSKKFTQVPQLSASKPADLYKPFSLFGTIEMCPQLVNTVPQQFVGFAAPQTYPPPLFGSPTGYPPQQPGYPPQQTGYPPQQPGYPPQQPGYPPQQAGYPPQQPGYPPQQPGYPPQQPGYPPQQPGYPPQQGYPQQRGYPPQQAGYPPQQPGYPGYPAQQPAYPPQPGYPPQGYPPQQAYR